MAKGTFGGMTGKAERAMKRRRRNIDSIVDQASGTTYPNVRTTGETGPYYQKGKKRKGY